MAKAAKGKGKAKAAKVLPMCLCGCGDKVGSSKSTFRPGHDAKVHSLWLTEPGKLSTAARTFAQSRWPKKAKPAAKRSKSTKAEAVASATT